MSASGGFFLLAVWFGLCCGWDTALTVLAAAAIHEAGHLLALKVCGGRLLRLRIGVLGAVMEVAGSMGYGRELLTVLAGPGANLAAAIVLGALGFTEAAGANAVLCAFNLLPIPPLDGGRSVWLLLSWAAGPGAAEWGIRYVGFSVAAAVCCGAVWLMGQTGGSLWLLPAAAGVLTAGLRCLTGRGGV